MQVEECGAACLTMILNFYGGKISITDVRKFFDIGRNGVSALDIVKAARTCEFEVKAFWVTDLKKIKEINLPAIAHWSFNHFVVIEKAGADKIVVVDPAYGRKELSYEEFESGFGGTVITLAKNGEVLPSYKQPPPFWINFLRNFLNRSEVARPYRNFLILSLILSFFGILPFYFIKEIIDSFNNAGISIYSLTALGLISAFICFTVFDYLRLLKLNKLKREFNKLLTGYFFNRLLNLPFPNLQRMHGDLLHRIGNINYVQGVFFLQIAQLFGNALSIISFCIILFIFALPSAVFIVLVNGFVFLTVLYFTTKIESLKRAELYSKAEEQNHLTASLKAVYYIKATGAESEVLSYWDSLYQNTVNTGKSTDDLNSKFQTFLNAAKFIFPILLLWFNFVYGNISLGTNLAVVGIAVGILSIVSDSGINISRLIAAQTHFVRLREILEIDANEDETRTAKNKITGKIECNDLSFGYSKSDDYVLKNINFKIEPSQKIVFLGGSSSGKTTIINLLLGLYEIKQGDILYDDVLIKHIDLENLRSQIGFVPQDSYIFAGSILENLCFGRRVSSPEEIVRAAQLAEIHEEIMKMPLGYETVIGDQAYSISAGQKQRLSIARGLVGSPALVIFDECFKDLDSDTIKKIDNNIRSLDCTKIFATSNTELAENSDFIYVCENGKIINSGNYTALTEDKADILKFSGKDLHNVKN